MTSILVTGGTGNLGRPTVEMLRSNGHDVRVLSRTPGAGRSVGDLTSGAGLTSALNGVHTVLHLATSRGSRDAEQTRRLVTAARDADVQHLIYSSIVGIDHIPFSYYRAKLECERMIEGSGVPFTILRATQFHDFVADLLRMQRVWPLTVGPDLPVQPIAVREVAARLAELAAEEPAVRVADIGGPEIGTFPEFAAQWQSAHGVDRRIVGLKLPGRVFAAFRSGAHLAGLPGHGRERFAEFAERTAAREVAR